MIQVFDKEGRLKSSGDGAPNDATYILINSDSNLPNARTIAVTIPITLTDGGSGNSVTVGMQNSGVTAGTYGDATNVATITVDSKGIVTNVSQSPISTGIISLNGLTASVQTFAEGTTGTDFNISSSGSVHTFNLPTASATNRGLLSTSDWTTFNNKLSTTLAAANIIVGNELGVATPRVMSGDATIDDFGVLSLVNASVIGQLLTGYVAGAGAVSSADSIKSAIQKLDGNITALGTPITGGGTSNQVATFNGATSLTSYASLTNDGVTVNVTGAGNNRSLVITNATGGSGISNAKNYLQIAGSVVDNSNLPGIELKGGTGATEYATIHTGSSGVELFINSGYDAGSFNQRQQIKFYNGGTATTDGYIKFTQAGVDNFFVRGDGKIGAGASMTSPTAVIHIAAGDTGYAPLRFTSGTLTTGANIVAGNVEFLSDKYYATITTGTSRKELTLNDIALTSQRIPFVTTNGRLTDTGSMFWDGTAVTLGGTTTPKSGVIINLRGFTTISATLGGSFLSWVDSGTNAYRVLQNLATTTADWQIFRATGSAGSESFSETIRVTNSAGDVGIGTGATVSARTHIIKTTEQLRVGYDASNYYSTTVGSTGGVTFDAVGSGALFTFSDGVTVNGTLTLSAQNIATDTTTGMKIGTGTTQKLGFWNSTPVVQSTGWTMTNVTTDKVLDANSTTLDEVADVLGTLIDQLKTYGILGG